MVRALAFGATAGGLAAVDLAHKADASDQALHGRSTGYVVVVVALVAVWAGAILLTGSLAFAVGGGVVAGGALGNLLSIVVWGGVPNPIVLEPIAFNLADIFVLAGFVLVGATALAFAMRSPERLREPVSLRS